MNWKERETGKHRRYETTIGELTVIIHRWQEEDHRWFLTVRENPFTYDQFPLLELDIKGAKKEAINLLTNKADEIQNALHTAAKRDSKKINNFKLRLVEILKEVEDLRACKLENWPPPWYNPSIERVANLIKEAISDLDH